MTGRHGIRGLLIASAAALALLAGPGAAAAADPSPLSWGSPAEVDGYAPFSEGLINDGVSCVSSSFCVVTDEYGAVMTSSNPTDGSAWTPRKPVYSGAQAEALSGVSCPSTSLCVAVDSAGNVVTSTDPSDASATWTVKSVDGSNALNGVSCPDSGLCVAVDGQGNILSSTNPGAGSPTWTKLSPGADGTTSINSISCVGETMCVAVDSAGNVLTSSDPTAVSPTWVATNVDGANRLTSVSCIGAPLLCVAVDNHGNGVASTDPLGNSSSDWNVNLIDPNGGGGGYTLTTVSCTSTGSSSSLCVAGDGGADHALASTDAGDATPSWGSATVPDSQGLEHVSCVDSPSALCIGPDSGEFETGTIVYSTDPGAGTPAGSSADWGNPGTSGGTLQIDGYNQLHGLSCSPGASTVCVGVGSGGNLVTSSDPAGGASKWAEANVDGSRTMEAIACPSSSLCLVGDNSGQIFTSSNPTDSSSWTTPTAISGAGAILQISCPSTSLCVGGDGNGSILTTTDPAGGASTWYVKTGVGQGNGFDGPVIPGVSCLPDGSLCAAIDQTVGNIDVSTNPTAGSPAGSGATWTSVTPPRAGVLESISCISGPLCVAVDNGGDVITSTDPAGGAADWQAASITHHSLTGVTCTSSAAGPLCVAVDASGNEFDSTNPGGGADTWSETALDSGTPESYVIGQALQAVSCATVSLCVAEDAGMSVFAGTGSPNYNLTVGTASQGGATGSVSSSPAGIDCGSTCGHDYAYGTSVTLTETPGSNSIFTGWGGDCSGTSQTCQVTMLQARSVTAHFTPPPQSLTVAPAGTGHGTVTSADGAINCPGTCSHTYAWDTQVTLTATPSRGSYFAGWSGGGCSGTDTCLLTLSAAQTVTATFSAGALSWGDPLLVDQSQPFESTNSLNGISCPTSSFCAAADSNGNVVVSSDASAGASAHWVVETTPAGDTLSSVSCPSASFCAAVDQNGNVVTSKNPGAGASAVWSLDDVDGNRSLNSISCPSASFCAVVDSRGDVITSTDPGDGPSATWNIENIDGSATLWGISCPTTSFCALTDDNGDVWTSSQPTVTASWAMQSVEAHTLFYISCASSTFCAALDNWGTVWTANPTAVSPTWASNDIDGSQNMGGISCAPGSTFCAAVDGNGSVFVSADASQGASASWGQKDIDDSASPDGISCPSSTFCGAVDSNGSVFTSGNAGDASPTWAGLSIDGSDSLRAVSCASASLCVSTDDSGNVMTTTNPAAGQWSKPAPISPNDVFGVSCAPSASTPLCVAVDQGGDVITSTNPTGGAGGWSAPVQVSSTNALDRVSCTVTPTTLCVATDVAGDIFTSIDPTGGKANWSGPVPVDTSSYLVGISCPTASLCVAADRAGNVVVSTDPTGGASKWAVESLDAFNFTAVSCTPTGSSALCIAVDSIGRTWASTDPANAGSWTIQRDVDPSNGTPDGISCPSTSLCTIVDSDGNVITTNDPLDAATGFPGSADWLPPVSIDAGRLNAVSCPTASQCVAVDDTGNVLYGGPPATTEKLTVSKHGSGAGTVTSSPGGISCGTTCSASFTEGTVVTLTARPAAGSVFSGWSGACSGTRTCKVTMTAAKSVVAGFVPKPRVAIVGTPTSNRKGVVVKLHCAAAAGQRCHTTETLITVEKLKNGKVISVAASGKGRKVVVGSLGKALVAGRTTTLTILLNATGKALLKKFHSLAVTLTIKLTVTGRTTTVATRAVRIKSS